MLPPERPDRLYAAFDDRRLVANAGLILPVTLAQHLGLRELVDNHVDLGAAPGRANTGDKMMTLVAATLAGSDCTDDADMLRTGRTAGALGCVVKAPSTLGTFLRSFRWGHVRQLDRVSRQLLAQSGNDWGQPPAENTALLRRRPPPANEAAGFMSGATSLKFASRSRPGNCRQRFGQSPQSGILTARPSLVTMHPSPHRH